MVYALSYMGVFRGEGTRGGGKRAAQHSDSTHSFQCTVLWGTRRVLPSSPLWDGFN